MFSELFNVFNSWTGFDMVFILIVFDSIVLAVYEAIFVHKLHSIVDKIDSFIDNVISSQNSKEDV